MRGVRKGGSVLQIAFMLAASVGLATCTRRYGTFMEDDDAESNNDGTIYFSTTPPTTIISMTTNSSNDESQDSWHKFIEVGKLWLPLSLPFLVGLGIQEVVLFHTTVFYIIGTLKNHPEQWGRWRLSAATAMGAAWGVQMALIAGFLAVALRIAATMKDGSFMKATEFSTFFPNPDQMLLTPILYATPVVTVCYWIMLSIIWKVDKKKKKKKEERQAIETTTGLDVQLIPETKI